MNKKIRPLYDRVLIERIEESSQTASGLYIPPTAQEKTTIGKVLAVGPGRLLADGKLVPLSVKVGDSVFFGKYAGTVVSTEALGARSEGGEQLIIKEDEILGVISPD